MFMREKDEQRIVIDTPAKINLFLQVLGKRPDGYHNINSVFQAVSLFDTLSFTKTETRSVLLEITGGRSLTAGRDNLIIKTYHFMAKRFGLEIGLDIKLEKRIPIAAGLGGGSADCAAVILAINILYNLQLSYPEMAQLGLELGSDVPFFFSTGQALVQGRGEILTPLELPLDYWLVLVNPGAAVSTAKAYRALNLNLTEERKTVRFASCLAVVEFVQSLSLCSNDFEQFHLTTFPGHRAIIERLEKSGAAIARLSGSGSTFFGLYVDDPGEKPLANRQTNNWWINSVHPISLPRTV